MAPNDLKWAKNYPKWPQKKRLRISDKFCHWNPKNSEIRSKFRNSDTTGASGVNLSPMRSQKIDLVNTCKNFSSLLRWSPNPIPSPRPLPRPRPNPGKINLSNASTRQHCRHAQIVDGWMHILKMISQSYPLQKHQVSFEFLASPSLAPPSLFPRHISWSSPWKMQQKLRLKF